MCLKELILTNYSEFDAIILDFDGVVVNSNDIKKRYITLASKEFCSLVQHQEFVEYFIGNNGIPREKKIFEFFCLTDGHKILKNYNDLLENSIGDIELTRGLISFLDLLKSQSIKVHILSGGDRDEVMKILKLNKIDNYFTFVMGGPKTKEENLVLNKINGNILFIGDSKKDYEVAVENNFNFMFMHGSSQFYEWKEYFKNKPILSFIKDFRELVNLPLRV